MFSFIFADIIFSFLNSLLIHTGCKRGYVSGATRGVSQHHKRGDWTGNRIRIEKRITPNFTSPSPIFPFLLIPQPHTRSVVSEVKEDVERFLYRSFNTALSVSSPDTYPSQGR